MSETQPSVLLAGDHAALVRRYVGSLYELADQQGSLDLIAGDMRGLRQLWQECPEWRSLASDPRLSIDTVSKAAAEVGKMCKVNVLTNNFVAVLASKRRLSILPDIIEKFLEKVAVARGEYHVDVRSAYALSASQRESLSSALNAVMGGKVQINIVEDKSILGGLTVKFGSQFIDASVKTKLDRLERTLKASANR